jgi:transcriptional regulator with PAS, ATPase and Fis domain
MPNDTISTRLENLKDPRSLEIREQIGKIADLDTPVLICGETGTGKDFWAGYLQSISRFPRMLNLNCGDVPETLLESEWFGYRKGAFTDADRDYDGKWKSAGDGIIFLNQIDLLSLHLQSKLLRIIERKRYYPLGSNEESAIDARFVFSADGTIEEQVESGKFRSDLYFRISTYKIFIPPLRERKKDLISLMNYFARKRGIEVKIDARAMEMLLHYPWPGNIRELENFVANAAIMGGSLTHEDVDRLYGRGARILDFARSSEATLQEMESAYIGYLLKKYQNKSRVASILKISRKSLYNKLKKDEKR